MMGSVGDAGQQADGHFFLPLRKLGSWQKCPYAIVDELVSYVLDSFVNLTGYPGVYEAPPDTFPIRPSCYASFPSKRKDSHSAQKLARRLSEPCARCF